MFYQEDEDALWLPNDADRKKKVKKGKRDISGLDKGGSN